MIKKNDSGINLDHLYELADGDNSFVREMIDYYLGQTPVVMKELHEYRAGREWQELGELAHKAKSSFKFMGIHQLTEYAKALEELCWQHPEENQVDQLIQRMEVLVKSSSAELRQELDKLNEE